MIRGYTNSSLISVIMPWHNTPLALVERAFMSLAMQEDAPPFELVICNDGSDISLVHSLETLLKKYRSFFDIKLCHHSSKKGISQTRNTAVKYSSGSWLVWLDSDDELTEFALNVLSNTVKSGEIRLGISECLVVHEDGLVQKRKPNEYLSLARKFHGTKHDPFAQVVFSLQAQIIHRESFEFIGGFNSGFKWAEVTEMFLRFACKFPVNEIGSIHLPLYRYYRNNRSHSSSIRDLQLSRIKALTNYARSLSIEFDYIRYLGRNPNNGVQIFRLVSNNKDIVPPYLS